MKTILPIPHFVFSVLLLLVSPAWLNAELVLEINTDNKTFSLTGNDIGNVGTFGAIGIAQWEIVLPGSGAGFTRSAEGTMFSVSVGAPTQAFGYDTEINIQFSGVMRLTLFTTQSGPATITGENVFLDYSSFSMEAQARLESSIGQSLALNVGGTLSGFSSIDVVEAKPEPILPGDVNLDEVVNLLDVSPLIALLSSGTYQVEADINEDGVVNLLDISPFIEILSGGM